MPKNTGLSAASFDAEPQKNFGEEATGQIPSMFPPQEGSLRPQRWHDRLLRPGGEYRHSERWPCLVVSQVFGEHNLADELKRSNEFISEYLYRPPLEIRHGQETKKQEVKEINFPIHWRRNPADIHSAWNLDLLGGHCSSPRN